MADTTYDSLLLEADRLHQLHFPSPEAQAQQRGLLGQVVAGPTRGVVGALASPFRAASAIPGVRQVAEPVAEFIEAQRPLPSGGVVEQGLESGVQSLATVLPLAATGLGPLGIAAGVGTLYGSSQFAETRNRLEKLNPTLMAAGQPPLTPGEISTAAGVSGLIEGGGEALANFFFARSVKLFGLPGAEGATQSILRRLLPANVADTLVGRAAATYGATLARELPTEAAQAAGQAATERDALGEERTQALAARGVTLPTAGEAAASIVGPVGVSSALFAGVATATQRRPQAAAGLATTTTAQQAAQPAPVTAGIPGITRQPFVPLSPTEALSSPEALDVLGQRPLPTQAEVAGIQPVAPPLTPGSTPDLAAQETGILGGGPAQAGPTEMDMLRLAMQRRGTTDLPYALPVTPADALSSTEIQRQLTGREPGALRSALEVGFQRRGMEPLAAPTHATPMPAAGTSIFEREGPSAPVPVEIREPSPTSVPVALGPTVVPLAPERQGPPAPLPITRRPGDGTLPVPLAPPDGPPPPPARPDMPAPVTPAAASETEQRYQQAVAIVQEAGYGANGLLRQRLAPIMTQDAEALLQRMQDEGILGPRDGANEGRMPLLGQGEAVAPPLPAEGPPVPAQPPAATGGVPDMRPSPPETPGAPPATTGQVPGITPVATPTEALLTPEQFVALAGAIADRLRTGDLPTTLRDLQSLATQVTGGTRGEGTFTPKDLYDATELALHRAARQESARQGALQPTGTLAEALADVQRLRGIIDALPTQTVRTAEQDALQQFSTPLDYAYAAAWAANLQPGDRVLEPSAGTGALATMAANGVGIQQVHVNELAPRRLAALRALGFGRITEEDALYLHSLLAPQMVDAPPTVVVMNPPFTAAARQNRTQGMIGARHVEEALKLLAPGGRLVAIVGRGMRVVTDRAGPRRPREGTGAAFRDWFRRIGQDNTIRASIGVSGDVYKKYGTTFGTTLLVIDKSGSTPNGSILTGEVETIPDLLRLLDQGGIRDARTSSATSPSRPGGPSAPEARGGAVGTMEEPSGRVDAVVPRAGARQPGPDATRGPEPGPPESGDLAGTGGAPVPAPLPGRRPGGSRRPGVPGLQGREPSGGGATASPGTQRPDAESRPELPTPEPSPGDAAGGLPGVTPPQEAVHDAPRVSGESATPEAQTADLTESVFTPYQPQRVAIAGAQAHPGALVQSTAMGSVMPPAATYTPSLPQALITEGRLSNAQLETIVYAGQAHTQMLPTVGEQPALRRGFLIGDGTGVGKGREIAGIIADNMAQGRRKAVWVSEKSSLLADARRDWRGAVNGAETDITALSGYETPKHNQGILFTTYDTLKMADKKDATKTHIAQLVHWLGKDYDGVIVFDEAHAMGNSLPGQGGGRQAQKASQKALAGIALQHALPNARFVYVSATAATEVSNLGYLDHLGLWGPKTAFSTKQDFLDKVSAGGVAAMELVARDMKALGLYTSRSLSYADVRYDRIESPLNAEQRDGYDQMAVAWQTVLQHIEAALGLNSGTATGKASGAQRSAALSQFWSTHQRFFNQVMTAFQTPAMIDRMAQDLERGDAVVVQIVNTNAATQDRRLAAMTEDDDFEELSLTPLDTLMEYVRTGFPVQQMEEFQDANGNLQQRPLVDSTGAAVENPQAVAMRDDLLDTLSTLVHVVPDGPLEMLLNRFGPDMVAEVTGRGQRLVYRDDAQGIRRRIREPRSEAMTRRDAQDFMDDRKQILIFSDKGGTGRSYHADREVTNQRQRQHYILQAGWRAEKAVQGLGRTHRTNQASAPVYHLVTTDLPGQKRFLSSIARRLDQLGALTRGQRQASSQGLFNERDNLESPYARDALRQYFKDLYAGRNMSISIQDFEQQSGLRLITSQGGLTTDLPPIQQFLNRLLSFTIETQHAVFNDFSARLDQVIELAIQQGTVDVGMETIRADRIEKVSDTVVATDPETGAETRHVTLKMSTRRTPLAWDALQARLQRQRSTAAGATGTLSGYAQNTQSGRVYAVVTALPSTDPTTGGMVERSRRIGVEGEDLVVRSDLTRERYTPLDADAATAAWNEEVRNLPAFREHTEHLITGVLLPHWDKLPSGQNKVYRVQTSDGDILLGRVIPPTQMPGILRNFGKTAEGTASQVSVAASEVPARVLQRRETLRLANDWRFKPALVGGEWRIELTGVGPRAMDEMRGEGMLFERIGWQGRVFVPGGPQAAEVIRRITETRPIVEVLPARGEGRLQVGVPGTQGALLAPLTQERVRRVFPGQQVTAQPDGSFLVAMPRQGYQVQIQRVEQITPTSGELQVGYGQTTLAPVQQVTGRMTPQGQGRFLVEVTPQGTTETLEHESVHFFEDAGLLTPQDLATLDRAIARQGGMPGYPDGPEARAQFLAERLNQRQSALPESALGRLIQKVQQFLDRLARLVGIRATGQIVRRVQSGALFLEGTVPGDPRGRRLHVAPFRRDAETTQAFTQSTVRDEAGQLRAVYHGTGEQFDQFAVGTADPQALYGPGFYFTEDPTIGSEYAQGQGFQVFTTRHEADAVARTAGMQAIPVRIGGEIVQYKVPIIREGANVRPVYLNIRNPFDSDALASPDVLEAMIAEQMISGTVAPDRGYRNADVYDLLVGEFAGDKRQVNAWLQAHGYDGITHTGGALTGGQRHRVWIAFSPDQVMPAFQAQGRLQVVTAPEATPRTRPEDIATEAKALTAYAHVANMLTPEERRQFHALEVAGRAMFRKEVIGDVALASAGEQQMQDWQENPAALQRHMQGMHEGAFAATEPQMVALSLLADEERQMARVLRDMGIITPERFTDVEGQWFGTHGLLHYATMAASTFGRGLRAQYLLGSSPYLGGAQMYQQALEELQAKLNAIPAAERPAFEEKLRHAFDAQDYTTLRKLAAQIPNSTWRERFFEFYYGSILSGIGTQAANEYSTVAYQTFQHALIKPVAGLIDATVARVTGRDRQIFASEALPSLAAQFTGLPASFKHAWWVWNGDARAEAIPSVFRQQTRAGQDLTGGAGAWARATSATGQPIEWMRRVAPAITAATRLMEAMDVGNMVLAFDAEVAGLAHRAALHQSIPADQQTAFEADYREHFWSRQSRATQAAVLEKVKQNVFRGSMGILGRTLVSLDKIPVLGFFTQLLMPFRSTPDALIRRGLELLPGVKAVPWYIQNTTWKWGGWLPMVGQEALTEEAMFMLAKQAVGTLMTMGVYALWMSGALTGGAPEDPAERDAFERQGKVPYAVKVGETWYSWRRFEPMSLPLGIMTSVFDALERRSARQERRGEVPVSVVHDSLAMAAVAVQSSIAYVMDASYFSGIANFFQGVQGQRSGTGDIPKGVMRQVASMITPFVGLQRSLINALDTSGLVPGTTAGQVTMRQPETMREMLAGSLVPLALTDVAAPARLNLFGQPRGRRSSVLGELLPGVPPVQTGYAPTSDLEATFQRLRYFPGAPAKTDALGTAYPRETYRAIVERRGELLQPRLERLVASRGFQLLPEAEQRKRLQAVVSTAGRQAKREVARTTR